jgi:hypothetical protein
MEPFISIMSKYNTVCVVKISQGSNLDIFYHLGLIHIACGGGKII